MERAEKERADAAALALLLRSAEALRPQVARAVAKAPAPVRGLGVELGDGEAEARREASWKAGLGRGSAGAPQREAQAAHDVREAILDNRVSQHVRAEQHLTAAAYLHHNMQEVRAAVGDLLVAHLRSTGNARLVFEPSPGAFAHALLAELRPADASACVSALQSWLAPVQLFELVDRNRAVLEDGASKSEDYAKGPKGPAGWAPAVGAAIGAELLAKVMQAMPKLAQRWLEVSERAAALGKAIAPSLRTLAPASALEQQVARAMLGGGHAPTVREVAATPAQVMQGATTPAAPGAELQLLEALVGTIATDLAVARQLEAHSRGRLDYSEHLTGKSLNARYGEALVEVAELRGQIAGSGSAEPARLAAVIATLEELRTETDLVKKIALLGQSFALFDEMTEDFWSVSGALVEKAETGLASPRQEPRVKGEHDPLSSAGRLGSMEQARRTAAKLKGELGTAHSKWLKLQLRLAPLRGKEASVAKAEIERELQALRIQLNKLGNDEDVRIFLARAQVTAKNATYRAIFAQMAVMIGASALSGGLGAVAEGAALQSGASAMTAMVTGTAVETASFSFLSSQLNGTSFTHELMSNGLGNFATFGAMRGTAAATSRTRLGALLAAGEAKGLTLLAAKAQALGAHTIVTAGVTYAQAQLEMLAKQGRTLTEDEQVQLGIQGMAMMIGGGVVHHGMAGTMESLRANGARIAYEGGKQRELTALAENVHAKGDPFASLQQQSLLRQKLEAELTYWKSMHEGDKHRRTTQGISNEHARVMSEGAQQSLSQLHEMTSDTIPAQLNLDPIDPGRSYSGTRSDVVQALDSYKLHGYEVSERAEDGSYTARKEGQPTLKFLERAQQFQDMDPAAMTVLHRSHRDERTAASGSFTYDAPTHTIYAVLRSREKTHRVRATLRQISNVAEKSPNSVVGIRTLKSLDEAENLLRQLTAQNFKALEVLGALVPDGFNTRDGTEFGIGKLPNGEFLIVKGEAAAVDWERFPGVKAMAHSHPSNDTNNLPLDRSGQARVSLAALLQQQDIRLLARELVFPSVSDFRVCAYQGVARHVVATPYVFQDGHVMKPGAEPAGRDRIDIEILNARRVGVMSDDGRDVFSATLKAFFQGHALRASGVCGRIPDHHLICSQSAWHLYDEASGHRRE